MSVRPLKVLFVTHAFPRHAGDAAGTFVLALANAVSARGVTVDVLAPSAPGLAADESIAGIRVRRFRYAPSSWETLAYTGTMAEQVTSSWRGKVALALLIRAGRRAVRRAVRDDHYDLVHCHWWFPSGLMCGGLTVPLLVTSHGTDVRMARAGLARRLFRRVGAQAAAMTAVSSWLARAASDALGGKPVGTAPMPATTALFAPDPATPRPSDRMLFVGRLNAQKGVADLLQALAMSRRPWSLDIVGDGPDRAALDERAEALSVTARVRWHGHVPQPALAAIYRTAAAVIIPSTDEGLGLVGVEASLCETPVVAYASGGLTDVVRDGETGWLVPTGDVAALAHAIDGVVDQPEKARRAGQAARRFAMERFSPSAVGARYRALYDDLLGRRA
ncbi:MAG: glycosyltransferase family 4 protein [Gemmatimonadetes bacterium]|nr:glycosyltransferase family 4 protein [Gemmatimonadota bacterium]